MKVVLVFLLLCLVASCVQGGWIRWRRIKDAVVTVAVKKLATAAFAAVGKRDDIPAELQSADINGDGVFDESEIEKLISERDAEDVMKMLNEYVEKSEDLTEVARNL